MGQFIGEVRTRWLSDRADNRCMELITDFAYCDDAGIVWTAPAGSVINGASIPRIFWRILGSPYCGSYRYASVVHDVACMNRKRSCEAVHKMFYQAMLDSDVPKLKALVMYFAVKIGGPHWRI